MLPPANAGTLAGVGTGTFSSSGGLSGVPQAPIHPFHPRHHFLTHRGVKSLKKKSLLTPLEFQWTASSLRPPFQNFLLRLHPSFHKEALSYGPTPKGPERRAPWQVPVYMTGSLPPRRRGSGDAALTPAQPSLCHVALPWEHFLKALLGVPWWLSQL